jgi:hypothetical protein
LIRKKGGRGMAEPARKQRLKGVYEEQDLRRDPAGLPQEADAIWRNLIAASWDMTIVEVAFNDLRHPLTRVPDSLATLLRTVPTVQEEGTLGIVEDEVQTGIEHFTEIIDGLTAARSRMEEVAHEIWKRRQTLKLRPEVAPGKGEER